MSKNQLQHFIPRTYLRAWTHNQNSLWVYNKDNLSYCEVNLNNRMFAQNYTYNITLKELGLMNDEEKESLLDTFSKYEFIDENGNVVHSYNVILDIDLIDKLDVFDDAKRKLSDQEKQSKLKNISFQRIDKMFKKLEDNWPQILTKFLTICDIENNNRIVTPKDYDDVFFFAKSMYSRNPEIVKQHMEYTSKHHPELNITEEMFRSIFLNVQIDLFKKVDEHSLFMLRGCSPCFIVATQNNTFVCPFNSAQYNFKMYEWKNSENSFKMNCRAWIPLSPKLLLMFVTNGDETKDNNVIYVDDINVEQLNESLIKSSNVYFISQEERYTDKYSKVKRIG